MLVVYNDAQITESYYWCEGLLLYFFAAFFSSTSSLILLNLTVLHNLKSLSYRNIF
jgi:hypothetical protein